MDVDANIAKALIPWAILFINALWGIALLFLSLYIRSTARNIDELNRSATSNAARLARIDTSLDFATKRLETIGDRTHVLIQDVASLKTMYEIKHDRHVR